MMRRRWTIAAAVVVALGGCGDDEKKGTVPTGDVEADAVDAAVDDGTTSDVAGDDSAAPADTAAPVDSAAPVDTSLPPGATGVVTLLDRVPTTLTGGLSPELSVVVPEGVVSITVSVLGDNDGMYGLATWGREGEPALVTAGWLESDAGMAGLCLDCPNRIAASEGAFAAIAPNNPAATVTTGSYTFTAFGNRPKEVIQSFSGQCGDNVCTILDQFQCPKGGQVKAGGS